MGSIEALSLAMGTAWTSGINLYATVAALGLAGRFEMIQLPQSLEVLTNPIVIAVACIMYAIEFFADKIPYVDNGWDVLHTFIRVPAGAILAARSLGEMSPGLEFAALLGGGPSVLLDRPTSPRAFALQINSLHMNAGGLLPRDQIVIEPVDQVPPRKGDMVITVDGTSLCAYRYYHPQLVPISTDPDCCPMVADGAEVVGVAILVVRPLRAEAAL